MTESIIVVSFDVESEAYQAFSDLKRIAVNPEFVISEACVVKNAGGTIVGKDAFDSGTESVDDTRRGSLAGSLVGSLGGPLGIILCGGMGYILGRVKDMQDTEKNANLIERVCSCIPEGTTALVALVKEIDPEAFEDRISRFPTHVQRINAAEVAEEVAQARELQRQLEKELRQKIRDEKKEATKQKMDERRAKMKADFEKSKSKLFNIKKEKKEI